MLAKKTKAHILSPGDNCKVAVPSPSTLCLQNRENELFCFRFFHKMPTEKRIFYFWRQL